MKSLTLSLVVFALVAVQISAQILAQEITPGQPPIRWTDYLSDAEKNEIGRKLAIQALQRSEAAGELYLKKAPSKVSFPVSFTHIGAASTESTTASYPVSGGNVTCDINTQHPHAGSGPGGTTVVKAKSSGTCTYEHYFGNQPPWIDWDLQQVLIHLTNAGPFGTPLTYFAWHGRTALDVRWSASSAQVFSTSCVNGDYHHADNVWVNPPPGWVYSGPQPIQIPNSKGAKVSNC